MNLRKALSTLLAAALMCGLCVPAFAAEGETQNEPAPISDEQVISVVKVNVGALNVRSGGGVDSPVIAVVRRGDVCEIVEEAYNWGKLANNAGWIYLPYTTPVSDQEPTEPSAPAEEPAPAVDPADVVAVVEVTVGALYVRAGGGVDYGTVSAVHRGDICELSQIAYDWGKLANGTGWIYLGSGYTKVVGAEEPVGEPTAPAEEPAPVDPADVVAVVEVTAGALYVRTGGGVDYPAVSAVHRGDICELSQIAYDWGKLANGAGWIYLPGFTKTVSAETEG